jgi:hypothetical protein
VTRERHLFQCWFGLILSIAFAAVTASAQSRPARVFVQASARDRGTLERFVAELRSDGFDVQLVAAEEPSPCAADATDAPPDPGRHETPFAGIELGRAASGARLVARLCHVPAPGRALLSAPVEDSDRLALAVVEALNGLTASPTRVRPAVSEASPRRAPPEPISAPSALNAAAVLVLQPTRGRPLAGASIGVEHAVHSNVALGLEVFMPLLASSVDGPDRELSIAAAWARLGARAHTSLSWLKLGASLHTGMSLIWATARTRDPALIGGAEFAKAALVSGGLWLESPSESPFFLRASVQASRLLPSARVELGGGRVQPFGDLFTELGLGFGLRWSR